MNNLTNNNNDLSSNKVTTYTPEGIFTFSNDVVIDFKEPMIIFKTEDRVYIYTSDLIAMSITSSITKFNLTVKEVFESIESDELLRKFLDDYKEEDAVSVSTIEFTEAAKTYQLLRTNYRPDSAPSTFLDYSKSFLPISTDMLSKVDRPQAIKAKLKHVSRRIPASNAVRLITGSELTEYLNTPKINRNDKCPCGSGKKYKHCCLN